MLGFESLLMQADIFDQVGAFSVTLSTLAATVIGIISFALTSYRKVTKTEFTDRDRKYMEIAKAVEMGFQKGAETIGSVKDIASVLYKANLTEAQRAEVEKLITPIIERENIRLQKANEQAALVKAKMIEIFGADADVDLDPSIPRESADISKALRDVTTNPAVFANSTSSTVAATTDKRPGFP